MSYGIVRVEEEGSYTSLTLQDVGHVVPGARIAVVKISGQNSLCKTDEIGELCVSSLTCGSEYWGLKGKSGNIFQIRLVDSEQNPIGTGTYVRSGLLGFIGAGGLVFVCGSMDGLIISSGRRHNREDITATVLAVDPPRCVILSYFYMMCFLFYILCLYISMIDLFYVVHTLPSQRYSYSIIIPLK